MASRGLVSLSTGFQARALSASTHSSLVRKLLGAGHPLEVGQRIGSECLSSNSWSSLVLFLNRGTKSTQLLTLLCSAWQPCWLCFSFQCFRGKRANWGLLRAFPYPVETLSQWWGGEGQPKLLDVLGPPVQQPGGVCVPVACVFTRCFLSPFHKLRKGSSASHDGSRRIQRLKQTKIALLFSLKKQAQVQPQSSVCLEKDLCSLC